jgi:hypothetical protein
MPFSIVPAISNCSNHNFDDIVQNCKTHLKPARNRAKVKKLKIKIYKNLGLKARVQCQADHPVLRVLVVVPD